MIYYWLRYFFHVYASFQGICEVSLKIAEVSRTAKKQQGSRFREPQNSHEFYRTWDTLLWGCHCTCIIECFSMLLWL